MYIHPLCLWGSFHTRRDEHAQNTTVFLKLVPFSERNSVGNTTYIPVDLNAELASPFLECFILFLKQGRENKLETSLDMVYANMKCGLKLLGINCGWKKTRTRITFIQDVSQ